MPRSFLVKKKGKFRIDIRRSTFGRQQLDTALIFTDGSSRPIAAEKSGYLEVAQVEAVPPKWTSRCVIPGNDERHCGKLESRVECLTSSVFPANQRRTIVERQMSPQNAHQQNTKAEEDTNFKTPDYEKKPEVETEDCKELEQDCIKMATDGNGRLLKRMSEGFQVTESNSRSNHLDSKENGLGQSAVVDHGSVCPSGLRTSGVSALPSIASLMWSNPDFLHIHGGHSERTHHRLNPPHHPVALRARRLEEGFSRSHSSWWCLDCPDGTAEYLARQQPYLSPIHSESSSPPLPVCDDASSSSSPPLGSTPPALFQLNPDIKNRDEHWTQELVSSKRHREEQLDFEDRMLSFSPRVFECNLCRKSYTTLNGLTKHQRTQCTGTSGRRFDCPHCDKIYSTGGALKMHIRTHTLPCHCSVCGKAFSRPWLLQGHMRTHTGERPFECPHCQRAFADRSNLRAHLQTHVDVKRYNCRRCAKTFSRMSLLAKHYDGNCS